MPARAEAGAGLLLAVENVTKLFGSFAACNGINLDIRPGEIHALLGENGAGKSTLVKMLFGVLAPTSGEISWQASRFVSVVPAPRASSASHGLPAFFRCSKH